jgi:hypothetical protein
MRHDKVSIYQNKNLHSPGDLAINDPKDSVILFSNRYIHRDTAYLMNEADILYERCYIPLRVFSECRFRAAIQSIRTIANASDMVSVHAFKDSRSINRGRSPYEFAL